MIIAKFLQLSQKEKKFINEAKKVAVKSVIDKKSFVGAIIAGDKGGVYKGATIARTRAIGSTCSERMALDQLYFNGKEAPQKVFIIGTFERHGWKNSFICTPCGACLEMFLESLKIFNISSLEFICSSWDKTRILKCELNELFPQIGKGKWKRNEGSSL